MKTLTYIINCIKASIVNNYRVYYIREVEGKLCAVPVDRFSVLFGIRQFNKLVIPVIKNEGNILFAYEGIEKDKGKLMFRTSEDKYVSFRFFYNLFTGGAKLTWEKSTPA